MVICRILGAVMLVLSGIGTARVLNRSASSALEGTEGAIAFLRYTRGQVECFALPLPELIGRCEPEILRKMGYRQGMAVPESMEEFVRCCAISDRQSAALLKRYAGEFGKNYREGQLRSCDYYLGLLEERRAALATALPAKRRLNSTLSISAALALVILFL